MELEEKILAHEQELAKGRQNVELQKLQIDEKRGEVDSLLNEASGILADLTGQKYSLGY